MVVFNLAQNNGEPSGSSNVMLGASFSEYTPDQLTCCLKEQLGFLEVEVEVKVTRHELGSVEEGSRGFRPLPSSGRLVPSSWGCGGRHGKDGQEDRMGLLGGRGRGSQG